MCKKYLELLQPPFTLLKNSVQQLFLRSIYYKQQLPKSLLILSLQQIIPCPCVSNIQNVVNSFIMIRNKTDLPQKYQISNLKTNRSIEKWKKDNRSLMAIIVIISLIVQFYLVSNLLQITPKSTESMLFHFWEIEAASEVPKLCVLWPVGWTIEMWH